MIKKNPIIIKEYNKENLLEFIRKYKTINGEIKYYYDSINFFYEDKLRVKELTLEMSSKNFNKQIADLTRQYNIAFGCGDYGDEYCLDINGMIEVLKYLNIKI